MIAKQEQGKKLGLALLYGLNEIAEAAGCYKVSTTFTLASGKLMRVRLSLIAQPRILPSMRSAGLKLVGMRCNTISIRERRSTMYEVGYVTLNAKRFILASTTTASSFLSLATLHESFPLVSEPLSTPRLSVPAVDPDLHLQLLLVSSESSSSFEPLLALGLQCQRLQPAHRDRSDCRWRLGLTWWKLLLWVSKQQRRVRLPNFRGNGIR